MVTSTCGYFEMFLGGAYACSAPKGCPYKRRSGIEFEFEQVNFCTAPGSNTEVKIPPGSMIVLRTVNLEDRTTALAKAKVDLNSN